MSFQSDDRVMQALNSIAVPTLVIVGGDDTHFLGAKNTWYEKCRMRPAWKSRGPGIRSM
jgi:pimeloyl-ACP methyl ester carboxylesterase